MKNLLLGALAASLLITTHNAGAAVDVLAFQENGPISLNGLGVAVLGQMQADPGPGGLLPVAPWRSRRCCLSPIMLKGTLRVGWKRAL